MEWEAHNISIHPWDDITMIMHSLGPIAFLRIKEDLNELIEDARARAKTIETEIHMANLYTILKDSVLDPNGITLLFPDESIDGIIHLYLRARYENDRLTAEDYDGLFRFEFDPRFDTFRHLAYDDLLKKMETSIHTEREERQKMNELRKRLELLDGQTIPLTGWKSDHHRMKYMIRDARGIGGLFQEMDVSEPWMMAVFYQHFFQWGVQEYMFGKIRPEKDPELLELWDKGQIIQDVRDAGHGLYLYRHDMMTERIILRQIDVDMIRMEMDVHPELLEQTLKVLHLTPASIVSQEDVGMNGQFFFKDLYIPIQFLQHAIMNDPLFSSLFYVNELKRTTFDNRLPILFRPMLLSLMDMDAHTDVHMIIRNTHRQTGFQVAVNLMIPIRKSRLDLFFFIMTRTFGRFQKILRPQYIELYQRFIPDISTYLERQQKNMIKNIKTDRPEYFSKYPRLFIKNFYSIICQKNLQPELITEEDARAMPSEHWIRFPDKPIEEIQPEYYFCPSPKYPYAGLKEMNLEGEDVFINYVPCCFNSNQEKDNQIKLSKIKTKNDVEMVKTRAKDANKKENIIHGKFLIKYAGQIGTIRPPSMRRLLLAIDPYQQYYRMGVEHSPSSLISCLLMARRLNGRVDRQTPEEVRRRISQESECIKACLQQNPGIDAKQIQDDIANPAVYFDPRRFLGAVELFFQIHLFIFTRPAEMAQEDATILEQCSMRSLYTNTSRHLPVIIIYEHWGGKINILSKHRHPHNELIVHRSLDEKWRVEFEQDVIFGLMQNSIYRFDGATPIFPFDQKETWFSSMIAGQYIDGLGKIRRLDFRIRDKTVSAFCLPPIAVQDNVPIFQESTSMDIPVIDSHIVRFLYRFTSWVSINIPDPESDVVHWRVRQDRVFWKTLADSSPIHLIIPLRLSAPRPLDIMNRPAELQEKITTVDDLSTRLIIETSDRPSEIIQDGYKEKIARCLYDLSFYFFSLFLKTNEIRIDGIDPDVLLDNFYRMHIIIRSIPVQTLISPEHAMNVLVANDKLIMPSGRFWQKIRFNLKWTLFNRPKSFYDVKYPIPSFYKYIYDFESDSKYYYFHLESLESIFKYAIEKKYPLMNDRLKDIAALPDFPLWYRGDESPYPSPSYLHIFPDLDACRELSTTIYLWNPDVKQWLCIQNDLPQKPIFVSKTSKDEYIILMNYFS